MIKQKQLMVQSVNYIKTKHGNNYIVDNYSNYLSITPSHGVKYISDNTEFDTSSYYTKKIAYLHKMGILNPKDNLEFKYKIKEEDVIISLANTRQITFDVTDVCNLNCVYCAYGKFYNNYDIRSNKKMDIRLAYSMLKYMNKLWNSNYNHSDGVVNIGFYGGEPLLNMNFIKTIVSFTENLDNPSRKFTYSMTTNGLLLDKYMDYLHEKKFDLLISLDGDSYGSALRIDKQGNPSFNQVLKNIDLLYTKYSDYFENHVNFNSVISKNNSIVNSYNFIKNKYRKTPRVSTINPLGVNDDLKNEFYSIYANIKDGVSDFDFDKIRSCMEIFAPGAVSFAQFIRRFSNSFYQDSRDLFFSLKTKKFSTGTCQPFSRKIFVTVNGKILPCERIGQNYSFGICTPDDVIIDNKYIVSLYNNSYRRLQSYCDKCYNNKECTECIFYIFDSNDHLNCNGFMSKKEWINKVTENIEIAESGIYSYRDIINKYKII